jgi:hypothetical protein
MTDDQGLKDFIARYAQPYDYETDDYDRPPFAADVRSPGRSDFYNFHYYLTKVPPEAIVGLILHYTMPGDLVLDPFCGSGMTGVASQMCAHPDSLTLATVPGSVEGVRPTILGDLSPAACHISTNYTHPAEAASVREEFARISARVTEKCAWLYRTEHYEPAIGVYDPLSPAVAERLTNGPLIVNESTRMFGGSQERSWKLVDPQEVESSLCVPISQSPDTEHVRRVDATGVDKWIRIPAVIVYTVWSDVYRCEGFKTVEEPAGRINRRTGKPVFKKRRVLRGCKGEIIARGADDEQADDGNNAFIRCPNCSERWMKGRIQRIRVEPVEVCYEYHGLKLTAGTPSEKLFRTSRPVSKRDVQHIHEIESQRIPCWHPDFLLNKDGPRYRRDSLAGKLVERYADFFTHRNLWALSMLWCEINQAPQSTRAALRFCFTSQIMRSSRLRRMRGAKPGEQLSGTLHIASETVESNVLRLVSRAVQEYQTAVTSSCPPDQGECCVYCGSATDLGCIPSDSIDYIFTDPPFGANIYYCEVNCLWEAWLGSFTDEAQEAVMHRPTDGGYKRLNDYASLMRASFGEMYRVLKSGHCATVEFNNSDGAVFEVIKQALVDSGFEIENMLIFDKVHRTYAQVRSDAGISEVVDKDVLFNLRKPAAATTSAAARDHDFEHQVVDAVRQHLLGLPERMRCDPATYSENHRTTPTIHSMLMNALIPRGISVDHLNLPYIERLCARYFRKVGQRWYLRGEAVGSQDGARSLIEDEVRIQDEVSAIEWIRQCLKAAPSTVGELKPLWMRATGLLPLTLSQTLVLERLLVENFWRDAENRRWREPTDEEREHMNDDRSIRVLHNAERFVAGTLRRSVADVERCEWIDTLFQACKAIEENETSALPALRGFEVLEGYKLITRLFTGVLRNKVPEDVYSRAAKQAEVSSQRLGRAGQPEEAEPGRKKSKRQEGPTLFDDL